MISEWWTYSPSDLLAFGPDAYWHVFETANRTYWPLPLILLVAWIAALIWLQQRPDRRRFVLVLLSVSAVCVGFIYFVESYQQINWAASNLAILFYALALAAVFLAAFPSPGKTRWKSVGLGMLVYAVFLHPFWPLVSGRSIDEAELIGLAPDPTAIGAIGLALGTRFPVVLIAPAAVWLAISAMTLSTLGEVQAIVPISALFLCAVLLTLTVSRRWRHQGKPQSDTPAADRN
ncbi:MAG: DUF6064 family protein [Pseudomonadota bacterium]